MNARKKRQKLEELIRCPRCGGPIPDTFGARLRAARMRAGLSLKEVAETIGIHYTSWQQYEEDRIKHPGEEQIALFAKVVSCEQSELVPDKASDNRTNHG